MKVTEQDLSILALQSVSDDAPRCYGKLSEPTCHAQEQLKVWQIIHKRNRSSDKAWSTSMLYLFILHSEHFKNTDAPTLELIN
jgi:hypothetical protein